MLLRLMPDQVSRYWEFFKEGISASLPPTTKNAPGVLNRVLETILAGGKDVWLSFVKRDGGIDAHGFVITQMISVYEAELKMLLIYAIYAPKGFTDEEWNEGFVALAKFAKSRNCVEIVGYTNDDHAIKRAEQFGGDTSYRYISIPLSDFRT